MENQENKFTRDPILAGVVAVDNCIVFDEDAIKSIKEGCGLFAAVTFKEKEINISIFPIHPDHLGGSSILHTKLDC